MKTTVEFSWAPLSAYYSDEQLENFMDQDFDELYKDGEEHNFCCMTECLQENIKNKRFFIFYWLYFLPVILYMALKVFLKGRLIVPNFATDVRFGITKNFRELLNLFPYWCIYIGMRLHHQKSLKSYQYNSEIFKIFLKLWKWQCINLYCS